MSASRTLIVAVTGHRLNQLPEAERPRIQVEIARCLIEAERAARLATGAPARCVLHSAIAEGADRYAGGRRALARGWRLTAVAVLGGAPRRIFPIRTRKSITNACYGLCAGCCRFRMNWWKAGGGGAAPYAAVGRALIEKADLLLCVWNGLPPKGPGGTSEVAALMLEKGGLVLWIPAEGGATKLVAPAPLPRAGSFRRALHEALLARFERIARPPEMRVA